MTFLQPEEKDLFYRLYFELLCWVNKKHKIVSDFNINPHEKGVDVGKNFQIKEKLYDNPAWFDDYLREQSAKIAKEEQEILLSWRKHLISGDFFVMRHLKKYSVFMNVGDEDSTRLYGVLGLTHPFSELIDKNSLPMIIKATILPFKGRIVFDGIFSKYSIRLGPGIRKSVNEQYSIIKTKYGIIESLPFNNTAPRPAVSAAKKENPQKPQRAKEDKIEAISGLIHQFCSERLNEEFLDISLHVLQKLSRKRPSPLASGRAHTWACGIIYAVASNNFVFDRSQPYYMSAQDIADGFGLSKSTAQNQAANINKMLKIDYFKAEYVIASLRDDENGLIQMVRRFEEVQNLFR
jgi:hypothetical protein